MKNLYAILGVISLSLGVLGIFVPGLPTVPFLLLASHLFYNSSKRLHNFVKNHKILGGYLRGYEEKGGMTINSKIWATFLTLSMSALSIFIFVDPLWVKWTIASFAIVGVVVVWLYVKSVK